MTHEDIHSSTTSKSESHKCRREQNQRPQVSGSNITQSPNIDSLEEETKQEDNNIHHYALSGNVESSNERNQTTTIMMNRGDQGVPYRNSHHYYESSHQPIPNTPISPYQFNSSSHEASLNHLAGQQQYRTIDPRIAATSGNFSTEGGQLQHPYALLQHRHNNAIRHHAASTLSAQSTHHAAVPTGPIPPSTPSYYFSDNNGNAQQYYPHPAYSSVSSSSNYPLLPQDQLIKNQRRQGAGSILMTGLFHRGNIVASSSSSLPGGINHPSYNNHSEAPQSTQLTSSIGRPQPSHQHHQQLASNAVRVKKRTSKAQPRPPIHVEPRAFGPVHQLNNNDVLCGRGGKINNHPGNVQFREFIAKRREEYLDEKTKKLQKAYIAAEIVRYIRYSLHPAGRFLKEEQNGVWYDIGDQKAIKKVGQAIREEGVGNKDDDSADEDNDEQDSSNEKQDQTSDLSGMVEVKSSPDELTLQDKLERSKEIRSDDSLAQVREQIDDAPEKKPPQPLIPNDSKKESNLQQGGGEEESSPSKSTMTEKQLSVTTIDKSVNDEAKPSLEADSDRNNYRIDVTKSFTLQPSLPVVSTSPCQTRATTREGACGMPPRALRTVVSGRGYGGQNRANSIARSTSSSQQSFSIPSSPASSVSTTPISNHNHHHPMRRPKQVGSLQPLAEVSIVPPSAVEATNLGFVSNIPSEDYRNRWDCIDQSNIKRTSAMRLSGEYEKGNNDDTSTVTSMKRNAFFGFPIKNRKINNNAKDDDYKVSIISPAAQAAIMDNDISELSEQHELAQQAVALRSGYYSSNHLMNHNQPRPHDFFGRTFHFSIDVTDTSSMLSGTSNMSLMSALTDQLSLLSNLSGSESTGNNNNNRRNSNNAALLRGSPVHAAADNMSTQLSSFSDHPLSRNVFTHRNPNANIHRDSAAKMSFSDHHSMNFATTSYMAFNPNADTNNERDDDGLDGMSWTTNRFLESSQRGNMHFFSSGASIASIAMSIDTHSYAPSIASVGSSMMSDLSIGVAVSLKENDIIDSLHDIDENLESSSSQSVTGTRSEENCNQATDLENSYSPSSTRVVI